MKAIVYRRHGSPDVLEYEEIDKPAPGEDEVLIKIRAASVNPLDWRMMKGFPPLIGLLFGAGRGKIHRPGHDVAGTVEQVGAKVTRFRPGDEVFGVCNGSLAEYACARESNFTRKPDGVTHEQAASLPVAGITALQGLRDKARVQAGQKILINGAAGGVGTFAVQIAKSFGADVTGVCSTGNMAMVRSLGASRVIDYTREDFRRSGETYDILLDCVGNCSFADCRRVVRPGGTAVIVGAPKEMLKALTHILGMLMLQALTYLLWVLVLSWPSRRIVVFIARLNSEDLAQLGALVASGKVAPVIDRRYRMNEIREAFQYMQEGHARGKVVVAI